MEDTLSNEERNAILSQVFNPVDKVEKINTPKESSSVSESVSDLSQKPFGELLDESLKIQEKLAEQDKVAEEHLNESREQAIGISRFDILKDWHL